MNLFFYPQNLALLFPKDKPFLLRCSYQMQIWDMQISAALGQYICASSINIWLWKGQNRDELFHFLCSTCVVPKMVSIEHFYGPNERQYLIQVI
jgi:hypothetical protein